MVMLNFQPRFVDPIRQGSKRQSIRRERHRDPRIGESLQLYVGLRTKRAKKILDADPVCNGVHPIEMLVSGFPKPESVQPSMVRFRETLPSWLTETTTFVLGDGVGEWIEIDEAFAVRDGFRSVEDFETFWQEQHGPSSEIEPFGRIRFSGNLIEW